MAIPRTVGEITSGWLTDTLRAGGTIRDASVGGFSASPLGEGQGVVASLAQVELHYDRFKRGAPSSAVAKLTPPKMFVPSDPAAATPSLYLRESLFYSRLSSISGMPTAACYGTSEEPETGVAALLLEDLSQMRPGNQFEGADEADCRIALSHLAAMHARWWDHAELDRLDWLVSPSPSADAFARAERSWNEKWPVFLDAFSESVSSGLREIGSAYRNAIGEVMARRATRPLTLCHGDFRLANMFFDSGRKRGFAALDWQLATRTPAGTDVGYFLCWSIPDDAPRDRSFELAEHYYEALRERGVSGYPRERFMNDCRLGFLRNLIVAVNVMAAGPVSKAIREVVAPRMIRRMRVMEDWKCPEFLGEIGE